jgi:DNA-binding transcriptional regulator YhcF (GntR family)
MIQIDPKDGVPIYRQVMDQVKLQIMTGQLQPGDQLESVKSLAGRVKVNPMTISKAYGFLVEEGVAVRRKGVGIFVGQVNSRKADRERKNLLSDALREAAGLTVQMAVPRREAIDLFESHLDEYEEKRGSES